MTTLHGGYDYCFFISFLFLQMSEIVNTQVILKDVRVVDIDDIKNAVVFGLRLDENEAHLMSQMFEINLSKLYQMNPEDMKNMNNIQMRFIQCELMLKIAKKLKLTMMSLEEFMSHEAIVNANFQYDEPQQRIWQEVQNYLNQLAASDGLDRVI